MAKRRRSRKKGKRVDHITESLLPLFILTVCIVFSFVFTVMMVPLGPIANDIKLLFIILLVVSTTVASAVSIIFYVFFLKG